MTRYGLLAFASSIAAGAVLSSCVPEGDPYRIGIRMTPSAQVEIAYADCGKPVSITSVLVTRSEAGARDHPSWKISSSSGSDLRRFVVVNSPPPGFKLDVPLAEPLTSGSYFVSIDSSNLKGESYSFDPARLRSTAWLFGDNKYLSDEEFSKGACG